MSAIGDTPSELDRLLAKAGSDGLTGPEHYRVAEALLNHPASGDGLAAAQVHATLAVAYDSVHRPAHAPPSEAFRDFVARIQHECNAITGMWEQLGDAETAVRDEAGELRHSDAAVRALVADRTGRPVPDTMRTPDAVRMLITRLDAQRPQEVPAPAPKALPAPSPSASAPASPPATPSRPTTASPSAPAPRPSVAAPRLPAPGMRPPAGATRPPRPAGKSAAAVTCQSCGGRKKEGHYLCRVCWFMLPEPTRTRLARRDALAYRRLAELHDQLRRTVPLTEITVREPI
ncbi:hypothetical protein [Spirillospora sp. NBC_01491]|uniref:hypothetical protein n=1 Tax=Spirillospora sp. NBC_01491 TaxID=2976007 RepID=UPI002E3800A8|nr:hypothetical protein [Spirillospora sp. NBC_01491]